MTKADEGLNIHTVLITRCGRGGLALGQDAEFKPIRIWLRTPRAVRLAREAVDAFARSIEVGKPSLGAFKPRDGYNPGCWTIKATREWALQ